jgi:hypothetical protein
MVGEVVELLLMLVAAGILVAVVEPADTQVMVVQEVRA